MTNENIERARDIIEVYEKKKCGMFVSLTEILNIILEELEELDKALERERKIKNKYEACVKDMREEE